MLLGTIYPAAGTVVSLIKDKLNGKDREFESGVDQYVYGLMHSAALGMTGEALQAFETGHGLETLAGPVVGDVGALGDILLSDKTDAGEKMDALKKYAVQRFGGPLRQALEDQ